MQEYMKLKRHQKPQQLEEIFDHRKKEKETTGIPNKDDRNSTIEARK